MADIPKLKRERFCVLCQALLTKQYRSLATQASRWFLPYFQELCVRFEGDICNQCGNKLNRLARLDENIKTKVDKLKIERGHLFETISNACKHAQFQTPRKGPKRQFPGVSPSPRGYKRVHSAVTLRSPGTKHYPRILPFTAYKSEAGGSKSTCTSSTSRNEGDEQLAIPIPDISSLLGNGENEGEKDNRDLPFTDSEPDISLHSEVGQVYVSVNYGGKLRKAAVHDPALKRVCKAIFNKSGAHAIVNALNTGTCIYQDAIITSVCRKIRKEIKSLCRENVPFLKGSAFDPSFFSWEMMWDKLKDFVPTLLRCFETGVKKFEKNDVKGKLPILCTSAAVLLHGRNEKLSHLQYTVGLIMDRCGLTTEGLSILNSIGVSVSQSSIFQKKKSFIQQQQSAVNSIVQNYKQQVIVEKGLLDMDQEEVSTGLEKDGTLSQSLSSELHQLSTVPVTGETQDVSQTVLTETPVEDTQNMSQTTSKQSAQTATEAVETNVLPVTKRHVPPIEILGDNVDVLVTPGSMTSERQRKSWHWFLTLVTQKRITDPTLPCDKPQRNILHVGSAEWIPTTQEMAAYHCNLQHHVARILLKYIVSLKLDSNCLPKEIPHEYLEKTGEKTVILVIMIDANENTSEGMITILNRVHQHAVPHTGPEVLERVVFGGDVLTNERAFTAQEARQNTPSKMDALKGIIHRPEGLHRQMNFLLSIYQTFYHEKSSVDTGTLYQLRNMLNRRNVSGPKEVTLNFRSHFQFVQDVMEGCIVAQFLKLHGMQDCQSGAKSLPVFSLLTQQEQHDWLLQQADAVMKNLQISDTSHVDFLRESLTTMDDEDHRVAAMHDGTHYLCPMCNKTYIKHGWFKKHLINVHKWQFNVKTSSSISADNPLPSFMRMALLLHDTFDAYKMCDGPRILQNAKLEWLYAGSAHHTKYRLWLWRMLAYDIAILTEREAFEYKWNSAMNLAGGIGKNIPNDNCVEINVHKIKSQLMTQGSNKSFNSAHTVAMTTQVVDSLKESVMRASKTIKGSRKRPAVDKSNDVEIVAKCFMDMSDIASNQWKSFAKFRDPLQKLNTNELHEWIREQKLICSKLM